LLEPAADALSDQHFRALHLGGDLRVRSFVDDAREDRVSLLG
jgi:hypothetical protein